MTVLVEGGSNSSSGSAQDGRPHLRIDLKDIADICASISPQLPAAAAGGRAGGVSAGSSEVSRRQDAAVDKLAQVLLIARDQGLLDSAADRAQDKTRCSAELRAFVAPLPQRPLLLLLLPP